MHVTIYLVQVSGANVEGGNPPGGRVIGDRSLKQLKDNMGAVGLTLTASDSPA